jgi:hypothetical protein
MQLSNKPITFLSRLTGVCSSLSALILMGMLLLASAPAAAQNAGTSPTPAAGMVCKPGFATRANACGGRTGQYCSKVQTPRGNTCVPCDPGHASPDGKDCRPCDSGMIGNTERQKGATMCVYPRPGKTTMPPTGTVNTYTVDCASGTYNPGYRVSAGSCIKCPVNTFSLPGSAKCLSCPQGKSTKGTYGASSCF